MKKKETIKEGHSNEFLFYTTPAGDIKIEIFLHNENVWLTQDKIALLFGVQRPAITKHLKNIFENKELIEESVSSILEHTAKDRKKYLTKYYNLDAIISVGYRVNSKKATQFRIWATKILKQFAIKGYVLDRKRLENGSFFNKNYFNELLDEIREIRLSERNFYQKVTDIYSTSIDYDKNAETTREFFAKVQNKLHFAIHQNTAPELIMKRANAKQEHMGLTSWKNAPKGKIIKTDVSVAKNYLKKEEIESLSRMVSAYLDLAEDRAKRKIPMNMEDWSKRLDAFLKFDERELLENAGSITQEIAKKHAESEFEKYRVFQDRVFKSDFDKLIEKTKDITKNNQKRK